MSNTSRDNKITSFVRNVLGCGCPDEVFEKIDVTHIGLGQGIAPVNRIVIGDTLLVYITPDSSIKVVADNISTLVIAGKQDRDSHGYNRFRLVVPSSDKKDLEDRANAVFSVAVAGDEKLHIHFIEAGVLNRLRDVL